MSAFALLCFTVTVLLVHSSCACDEIECRKCIDDKSDACVWCADSGGACVAANSSAAQACSAMPESSFQQCPDLERRDAAALTAVFRSFRSAVDASNAWAQYLDEMLDDVASLRCPRPPPRTTPSSGWSCIGGAVWTMQLDPASVRFGGLRAPQIAGTIHAAFANLTELRVISIKDHLLTGTVPPLNAMTSLTSLQLNANQLSGTFPPVDRLGELEDLWINNNQFDGALPALPTTSSLKVIHFENNRFSGALPSLDQFTRLQFINVKSNRLSGTTPVVPASVRSCSWGAAELDDNCYQIANCTPPCACPASLVNCELRPSDRAALSTLLAALQNQSDGAWDFSIHQSELANRRCPSGAPVPGIVEQKFTCIGGRLAGLTLIGAGAGSDEKLVPDELLALDALEELRLPGLSLAGAFPSLQPLRALKFLDLSDNYLESVDVYGATAIEFLYLKLNRLRALPELDTLFNLRVLELQQNLLTQLVDAKLAANLTRCVLGAPTGERNCFDAAACPSPCMCPPNVLGCRKSQVPQSATKPMPLDGFVRPTDATRGVHEETPGAIAGYAIMGVALFLTIIVIVYCLWRQSRKEGGAFRKFSEK
jgi:Leucine-rich repeat (LRR) protein